MPRQIFGKSNSCLWFLTPVKEETRAVVWEGEQQYLCQQSRRSWAGRNWLLDRDLWLGWEGKGRWSVWDEEFGEIHYCYNFSLFKHFIGEISNTVKVSFLKKNSLLCQTSCLNSLFVHWSVLLLPISPLQQAVESSKHYLVHEQGMAYSLIMCPPSQITWNWDTLNKDFKTVRFYLVTVSTHIYTYMHAYMYVYIYIYMENRRKTTCWKNRTSLV